MPAELFAIHFPKSLHKATNGRVPKRYVIGTIPPAVLPAYRAVRSAVFRFCRFVDRWKWLLLLALLIIYGLARVFKNGLPGADAPHPTVYREKMQKARWYGVNY